MKSNIVKNLAYYLCQRLYCLPTGRELNFLVGNGTGQQNIDAIADWIGKNYIKHQTVDIDWWEIQLRKHLIAKGVLLD